VKSDPGASPARARSVPCLGATGKVRWVHRSGVAPIARAYRPISGRRSRQDTAMHTVLMRIQLPAWQRMRRSVASPNPSPAARR